MCGSVRGVQHQPARLSRRKPKENAMWHSAPACTESCSCQARCLCLPPRLVTLEICHQGLGTAACHGCSGHPACPDLLLAQHEGLAVELSLGYSLVWHLPPELVVKLLLFCFQHQQLVLQQRCSSRIEKPRTLLYLLYLLSLPHSPPLAKLKLFQQFGW